MSTDNQTGAIIWLIGCLVLWAICIAGLVIAITKAKGKPRILAITGCCLLALRPVPSMATLYPSRDLLFLVIGMRSFLTQLLTIAGLILILVSIIAARGSVTRPQVPQPSTPHPSMPAAPQDYPNQQNWGA